MGTRRKSRHATRGTSSAQDLLTTGRHRLDLFLETDETLIGILDDPIRQHHPRRRRRSNVDDLFLSGVLLGLNAPSDSARSSFHTAIYLAHEFCFLFF